LPVIAIGLGALSAAIWLHLLFGRGRFWLGWAEPSAPALAAYPAVVAVIPARNEAAVIAASLRSLVEQGYPGDLRIVVVDDHSTDGTADVARAAGGHRTTVLPAPSLPAGWAGKVWAMESGWRHVAAQMPGAGFVLFTDADIAHGAGTLARLVERAEAGRLDLVSLMVRLCRNSWAERALIPAFVYFFRMLYPFASVNDPRSPVAAAAGGCMLVRRSGLERIDGLAGIRDAIIDDCALGRRIKAGGAIRLDVADSSYSLRGYPCWRDVWRLIARTAYAELRYSVGRLAVAVLGMAVVFLVPPALAVAAGGPAAALGAVTWLAMAASFVPCLRYYRASLLWAPLLPLIALFYVGTTVDSARRHWRGRGGEWKGRYQAAVGRGGS
jgi:hopene-associated glycosyltransferase HpnB